MHDFQAREKHFSVVATSSKWSPVLLRHIGEKAILRQSKIRKNCAYRERLKSAKVVCNPEVNLN